MEPKNINGSSRIYEHDIIGWFEDISEKAGQVQTETLRRILELNWGVEYLNKWFGDINIKDMDATALESLYTSLVPLSSHADLEPYISRIADGDTAPLLTRQPIKLLSLSSGTTEGRQKLVPFTDHSARTTLQIFSLAAAYRSRVYPTREGGRILEFIYSSKQFKTKGGVTVGTATTHYYESEEFKIKQEKTKCFTCSPQEVISGGDYRQSTYCHLLLGLFFCDQVDFITSTFAYSIVQAFREFEVVWREICNDIKKGTLSERISLPKMSKAVLSIISPNPSLASKIEESCEELENKNWAGLITKFWPNSKYVYSIMTGSMQPYLQKLRHYAGDLPLVSADYGSTESWIGANVDPYLPPEDATFAVIPTFSYYEFMPLYRQNQDCGSAIDDFIEDEPVPLSKVKEGQEYDIVLTTFTGLYRCKLGDVVEVTGFHKGTPKLNFICRRKLILTINIDKNTEKDLQMVVEKGSQLLVSKARAELVDFTSHAELETQPGHYIIYWEIKGDVGEDVLGECCRKMDASFVDHGYVVSRSTNSIGPLELCIVKIGTFKKILEYFIGIKCKLGDVVEVTGFHNGTPKLNFICRRKLILTINIDKNTEKDLQMVVEKGSQLLVSKARAELVDFTSHAELETQPGHYIIYWEIKGDVGEDVLGECCRKMDASFVDHGYVVSRSTNSIGPLELCIVKIGTFKKILEYFIGNGAALSQFKTPRCTSNHGLLKILSGSTIKRIYSTAYS